MTAFVKVNKNTKYRMPKGCVIYCIEAGWLERNTLLSIASIRQFGGKLNDFDILCVQPRANFNISKNAKNCLAEFGADFIKAELNKRHSYYALANKPLVCDYVMKNYEYDQYVFLDSDTLVLNEPTNLFSFSGDIAVCPVTHKGAGMLANSSTIDSYWSQLLHQLQIDTNDFPVIETSLAKEKIIAYWNSGVILFNGRTTICEEWKALLMHVLDNRIYPNSEIFFTEQTCLSAVLLQPKYVVHDMSITSNFPLTTKRKDQIDGINLDEIYVLHHYNNLSLIKNHQLEIVGEAKAEWIDAQLERFEIYPMSFMKRLFVDVKKFQIILKEKLSYLAYRLSSN